MSPDKIAGLRSTFMQATHAPIHTNTQHVCAIIRLPSVLFTPSHTLYGRALPQRHPRQLDKDGSGVISLEVRGGKVAIYPILREGSG